MNNLLKYLNDQFGEKITTLILFFIVYLFTNNIPDWDLKINILGHRSIVTHSILIPYLLTVTLKRYSSRQFPLIISAMYFAFFIHLSADMFPKSWNGFALITIPLFGRIGLLSPLWILVNLLAASYLSIKIIKSNLPNIYPRHFYGICGLCIFHYCFLRSNTESILMIPLTVFVIDYFSEKKIFIYCQTTFRLLVRDLKKDKIKKTEPTISDTDDKITTTNDEDKKNISKPSSFYKIIKFLFYFLIITVFLYWSFYLWSDVVMSFY